MFGMYQLSVYVRTRPHLQITEHGTSTETVHKLRSGLEHPHRVS